MIVFTRGDGFAVLVMPDGKSLIEEPVIYQMYVPNHDRETREALVEACFAHCRKEGWDRVQALNQNGKDGAFVRLFGRQANSVEAVGTVYRFHIGESHG